MLTCLLLTEDKTRLAEEDCKRFRAQYDPAAYSAAMWASGKWGAASGGSAAVPHIKEEKPHGGGGSGGGGDMGGGHPQSPATASPPGNTSESAAYAANFSAGNSVSFSNAGAGAGAASTTQSNNDILYETMSQVYPALSSSLGQHFRYPFRYSISS